MPILIGRLVRKTFSTPNGEFHLYQLRCTGGKYTTAVVRSSEPPEALKTAEYTLTGEWGKSPKGERQFNVLTWERYKKPDHQAELAILREAREHLDLGKSNGS